MSTRDKRRCFTFTWTVENVNYDWRKWDEHLSSPKFVVHALQESKFHLAFYGFSDENTITCYLEHATSSLNTIDCELALLSKDGAVLKSQKRNNAEKYTFLSIQRKKVFVVRRSASQPENKLIVRCRIWKNDGDMTEDVQLFARSRICIKKQAFLWNIKNLSKLRSDEKCYYQIKSMPDNEVLVTLNLLLQNPYTDENFINIQLDSESSKIKYCVLHLMPLNGFESTNQGISKEFLFSNNKKTKLFSFPFSKQDLLAEKDLCLPDDVLSFRFECTYSTGEISEEIESAIYDCESLASIKPNFDAENTLSASKRVLNNDLKSLFYDNIFSDMKLKTSTKTFLTHKIILSARSPVFKRMFSHNMKEIFNGLVEIEDMDSDTIFKMLHFIYTAEVQVWHWKSAFELYRAADRYEILSLRDECSTYLKSNLSPNNACGILILADMHQDQDLKACVQEFIFKHEVFNSEEWKHLIKAHAKLAADTMYLEIQRLKFPGNKSSTIELLHDNRSAKINSVSSGFESSSTKTTSVSPVFNSTTANKPFLPSFLFDSSKENKSPESRLLKTGRRLVTFSSSGIRNKKEDLLSVLRGLKSNKTESQNEFSKKSDMATPSTTPWLSSTIPNLTTESSGFNNNKSLPSTFFNFSTTEKSSQSSFSFGNCGQETFGSGREKGKPAQPSFSFWNSSVKEPAKLSFPIGNSNDKEPAKPSFPIGNSSDKDPVKPSFSFGNKIDKEPVKTFFSIGNRKEKVPVETSFSFGNKSEKDPVRPSFSFVNNSSKEPIKTFFSFENTNDKELAKPSFSFNKSCDKPIKPSFSYGNSNEKESAKLLFSFTSSGEKEPIEPTFPLGNSSEKGSVQPTFSFTSNKKEPAEQLFPSVTENEPVKESLSFDSSGDEEPVKQLISFNSTNEKKTAKSFSFGNSTEKKSVTPLTFASSGEKKYVNDSLSFSFNDEKKPVKSFLFEKSSEKETIQPLSSFDSSEKKEADKQCFTLSSIDEKKSVESFLFGKSSEVEPVKPLSSFYISGKKEPDKQSFPLSRNDEKREVNQSFTSGSSFAEVPSSPTRLNGETGRTNLEFPRIDSSSATTTCEASESGSEKRHSTNSELYICNAKTQSVSLEFKDTDGDPLAASGIDSSITDTSTETKGISSNTAVEPSVPFFPSYSVCMKSFASSSGFEGNNEEAHFSSPTPTSYTSSVETSVSSGFVNSSPKAMSDFEISDGGKLTVSTGCSNSASATPKTSEIDSGSAEVPSVFDCTSAEIPESPAFISTCAMIPSGLDSNNGSTLYASHTIYSDSKETTMCSQFEGTSAETQSASSNLSCDNGKISTSSENKPSSGSLN